jgi:hypothetical protein
MDGEAGDEFNQKKQVLFEQNEKRLREMAHRAFVRGLKSHEFLIVCIDVDDPSWTGLVDALMPEADWQQFRDRGEKPVARGSVLAPVRDYLADVVPDLADGLYGALPEGIVRAVVMADRGASLYHIEATPEGH